MNKLNIFKISIKFFEDLKSSEIIQSWQSVEGLVGYVNIFVISFRSSRLQMFFKIGDLKIYRENTCAGVSC